MLCSGWGRISVLAFPGWSLSSIPIGTGIRKLLSDMWTRRILKSAWKFLLGFRSSTHGASM